VEELKQRSAAQRANEEIKARARELLEQNGCPEAVTWSSGFESEIKARERQV